MLSGGEAAKLALGCTGADSPADILLFDEPTNDLDFEGLDGSRRSSSREDGATVVVSHDRAFLERTVTAVLELDEHDHTGPLFDGGWDAYEEERATARRHAEEAYALYDDARKQNSTARARREREWATTGVRKERRTQRTTTRRSATSASTGPRSWLRGQGAPSARRSASRWWTNPGKVGSSGSRSNETQRSGDVVARLDGAVIERGSSGSDPSNCRSPGGIVWRSVGRNGAGKSTPRRSDARPDAARPAEATPRSGSRRRRARSGAQALSRATTLLEAVCARLRPHDHRGTRTLLAKFGLGADHVTRLVARLSPGERTRAELATFQARGVNLLVLDEPTNHLDLPAIEQLEQALESFGGTHRARLTRPAPAGAGQLDDTYRAGLSAVRVHRWRRE